MVNRKISFSAVMPVFFNIACRVPFFRGLFEWTGIVTVIAPLSVNFMAAHLADAFKTFSFEDKA